MNRQYIRAGKYDINQVLPFTVFVRNFKLHKDSCIKEFDGKKVKMNSLRYQTFATKGVKCVKCGIEGKFFALEQDKYQPSEYWHFNLYGIDESGNEVLMTKDHIVPASKGGKDRLKNLQTMCTHCNAKKKDIM